MVGCKSAAFWALGLGNFGTLIGFGYTFTLYWNVPECQDVATPLNVPLLFVIWLLMGVSLIWVALHYAFKLDLEQEIDFTNRTRCMIFTLYQTLLVLCGMLQHPASPESECDPNPYEGD